MNELKTVNTLAEAAEYFRKNQATILRWVKSGKLSAYQPSGKGGQYSITAESINAMIQKTSTKEV